MGDVIPFPTKSNFKEIEDWIFDVCLRAGYSKEAVASIIAEYRPIHEQIFDERSSRIEFPAEANFTTAQLKIIKDNVKEFHMQKIADCAHIIIGLIARTYEGSV